MLSIKKHFKDIHHFLVSSFEHLGCVVHRDAWCRDEDASGESCLFEKTGFLERGGINFSSVYGTSLPSLATNARPYLADSSFFATGVSLVLHPFNPYVPTVHMNVRFFCTCPQGSKDIAELPENDPSVLWWVGGGMDLTPYYGFRSDAHHFHRVCHDFLSPFGDDLYPQFKKNCDDYFFLKHRQEPRGIGGIFFDDFTGAGLIQSLDMVKAVGQGLFDAYAPLVQKRAETPYGERERNFQLYRRGRYVEFNLLWDRGTMFGLQSNGRTESILVSLPPVVHWTYNWEPEDHSPEKELYDVFLKPRDWLHCWET